MKWFKKLFGKKSTFVGDFIVTGNDLLSLAASNEVVAAELKEFEGRVANLEDGEKVKDEAYKSSEALSGYGISVSKQALLETLDQN